MPDGRSDSVPEDPNDIRKCCWPPGTSVAGLPEKDSGVGSSGMGRNQFGSPTEHLQRRRTYDAVFLRSHEATAVATSDDSHPFELQLNSLISFSNNSFDIHVESLGIKLTSGPRRIPSNATRPSKEELGGFRHILWF